VRTGSFILPKAAPHTASTVIWRDRFPVYLGRGQVTSTSVARREEGTTFEASCYTDPLGLEHLTGSLSECIRFFGAWSAPAQLRFTTKFDAVDDLLALPHNGKTRIRFSVNAAAVARNWEGGTATLAARLAALGKTARAGYPVGLTIAPIMPIEGWREQYLALFQNVATELRGISSLDLTIELITHRFTPKSKLIQLEWYPKTTLDLDESRRTKKMTKFGSPKFVYDKATMSDLRQWFEVTIANELPFARTLYWT
jgi:spore photoproduct lyase